MKIDITKQKIISSATKLIDMCENPSKVTSRAIAKEAGVQLAMINYCFGSREKLFFDIYLNKMKEKFDGNAEISEIMDSNLPPKEKLRRLHYKVSEFLLDNFAYTQIITSYILLNRDLTQPLNSLPFVIEHYKGKRPLDECKAVSYELSSVMQLALYRHNDLKEFCGFDFNQKEHLHRFIDLQIDLFLV